MALKKNGPLASCIVCNKLFNQTSTRNNYCSRICSKKEKFKVLYIHTKGVRHNNQNINVQDWIEYLSYFNIVKYKKCIEILDDYDAVGVNLTKENPIHYSGNFWWSKSDYINKLDVCKFICYNSPEFWLTEKNIGKYYNLWSSNVNHYNERYQTYKYIDKII